jgi:hypothetical protein
MPAERLVHTKPLDTVVAELNRSSAAALEASDELLAHFGDTGSAPSQRAVDTLIDHAADALRALTDSLADISGELQTVAAEATVPRASSPGSADGYPSWTRPGSQR